MSSEYNTIGEMIDAMPIEEIINHEQFHQLRVFKGVEGPPDYWEIKFESNKRDEKGRWLSFYNQPLMSKFFMIYKTKP